MRGTEVLMARGEKTLSVTVSTRRVAEVPNYCTENSVRGVEYVTQISRVLIPRAALLCELTAVVSHYERLAVGVA